MGQQANSGRNATLDEKKSRSAGRQQEAREKLNMREHGPAKPAGGAGGNSNRRRSK
ncbi:MAG TPA: hypothetical protein VGP99_12925 [Tepidisphaeraceae bacterium]|jgi:hypothetical protein|nr:hypothetical protein [Tepidisphaeraceae bacterium]